MYFIYRKDNGEISPPVRFGQPSQRALNKEADCELGSGIKWENVDLFYAPDEEFPEDFARTAPLGKYYVDIHNADEHIEENLDWVEEEDDNE